MARAINSCISRLLGKSRVAEMKRLPNASDILRFEIFRRNTRKPATSQKSPTMLSFLLASSLNLDRRTLLHRYTVQRIETLTAPPAVAGDPSRDHAICAFPSDISPHAGKMSVVVLGCERIWPRNFQQHISLPRRIFISVCVAVGMRGATLDDGQAGWEEVSPTRLRRGSA
ncbi:hypothetical protein IE81DRAFT_95896 [Ceraceosorus guamensis]|uniref:Uncharacterized protein n=1 Tax=Ceraceosorus guamensis TaxID=1522189 RepID=A0A316W0L2_9BASI|nr:hypothetical protein IE81DRAFT_95896 [Ceraceosorus guamensis]PWN43330.1 hypothetical protein IE81DRAFT_95896 [Ceraceosorus guamensis]